MTRPIKLSMNSPHTEGWLAPLGRLIVNFAAIELQTYWWLGALAGNQQLPLQALEWPFKKRVDKICELLTARLPNNAVKGRCIDSWLRGLEIAKIRNALVHNPIVFGWQSGSEIGEPDIVGIPDVAHLGSKPLISKRIGTLSDLNTKVNETASLARQLFELLAACDTALAPKANT